MEAGQNNQNLNIWVLTDNKPGHRNQLEGLVNALSELRTTKTQWTTIQSRWQGLGSLLLCKHSKPTAPPDLILAAGHRTHIQLLALKKCLGKPAVVLMKPSLPLSWFDLCLIPRHDNPPHQDNVIETIGAINKVKPSDQLDQNKGLILIGGPSRHFEWDDQGIVEQIKTLLQTSSVSNWQLATSRRTTDDFSKLISTQLPELKVVHPDEADNNWLPSAIRNSAHIWVTPDSISMVYESLTSGAYVRLFSLNHKSTRVSKEVLRLIDEGRLTTFEADSTTQMPNYLLPKLGEAGRCAELMLDKLKL